MILREDTNFQTETKKYAVDPDQNYTAVDLEFVFFLTVMGASWTQTGGQTYVYHTKEELEKYITLQLSQESFSLYDKEKPKDIDLVDCTLSQLTLFEGALYQGSTKMSLDKIKPLNPICVSDKA